MKKERLQELLSKFPTRRIAVLGDYFLDRYLDFDSELAEISLETGKTANQVVNVRHSPGAAGTVVCNLHALGCGTIINIGFCGDDGEGYELRQDLNRMACKTEHLHIVSERRTPVYCKPRDIRIPGLEGESERFDTKNWQILPKWVEDKLIASIDAVFEEIDALIVMDQVEEDNCGAMTGRVREKVIGFAKKQGKVIIWADSRGRITEYPGVIIKPNQFEAVKAAFPDYSDEINDKIVVDSGSILSHKSKKPVLITRAELGMLVFDGNVHKSIRGVKVDEPIDPTGAGDSATAAAVLTLASGCAPDEAALVANLVASITVQQVGTTGTATQEQVLERLEMWHAQGG